MWYSWYRKTSIVKTWNSVQYYVKLTISDVTVVVGHPVWCDKLLVHSVVISANYNTGLCTIYHELQLDLLI